jgi:glycosyltransferase involved in cell wall biosynthesis
MRELIDLPARTTERLELALAIHPGEKPDLAALAAHGWRLLDPAEVAATPEQYARFVRGSRGEFGVAKGGYVASNCGWFSDRSACYLASGRPVVAQDTGWGEWLAPGDGVLPFRTAAEAAAAMDAVARDYALHSRAARATAERYFDSDKVLAALLDAVGAGA